jgi:hypothetical protein
MIARVKRVWEGEKRVTVILVEEGQIKETQAFLWMPEQQLQAALCAQVEKQFAKSSCPRFVVQLAPPERWGASHIEVIEMIHEPRTEQPTDDAPTEFKPLQHDDGESFADNFERVHGHAGQGVRKLYN